MPPPPTHQRRHKLSWYCLFLALATSFPQPSTCFVPRPGAAAFSHCPTLSLPTAANAATTTSSLPTAANAATHLSASPSTSHAPATSPTFTPFSFPSSASLRKAAFKVSLLFLGSSSSLFGPLLSSPLRASAAEPTPAQIQQVQRAFQAFNDRDLRMAESLFDKSVAAWEKLDRRSDEIAALIKARGNVKVDLKKFNEAIVDYDRVLAIMSVDGTKTDGSGEAAYSEYPDTIVQRGLAKEGLSDWQGAVNDYSQAISLWGGGRGEGINPFVLTFRGNALTRLGRYKDALQDFEASADLFLASRDEEDALLARANAALTYYELGYEESALKIMADVIRRQPGFTDMHVALAAHAWGEGNLGAAEKEWRFACENTSTGCAVYRDLDFVQRIRRWPPTLVTKLGGFLGKSKVVAEGGSSVLR